METARRFGEANSATLELAGEKTRGDGVAAHRGKEKGYQQRGCGPGGFREIRRHVKLWCGLPTGRKNCVGGGAARLRRGGRRKMNRWIIL